MNRGPWRAVTAARQRAGRGSALGPDTDRRAHWWQLTLACGHVVERAARYVPQTWGGRPVGRGNSRHRGWSDALPAPRRVRCDMCPREGATR